MDHVLITGGAGFIGSKLTASLLVNESCKITCLDNFDDLYSRKQKEWNINPFLKNKNYKFVEGTICEGASYHKLDDDINIIIHLAAKAGVRPSICNPLLYQEVNIRGTQMVLEYARLRSIKQFLYASSSSVYGNNKNVPWSETENLLPISPYAATKLSGEMIGHVFSHLYGIRFLALRFFTVYGPAQRPDLAIHKFFKSIIYDEPIPVFGDGSSKRDYTYIDDLIEGIISAMHYEKSDFEIINLGNNRTVVLNELISAIENICEKKAIIDHRPEQPGDVTETYADITKAKKLLNYNPITKLNDGLLFFYEWFKNYDTTVPAKV